MERRELNAADTSGTDALARIIHESPTAAARKARCRRRTGKFDPQRVLEHASGQIHPSPCPRTLRTPSLRTLVNNPG